LLQVIVVDGYPLVQGYLAVVGKDIEGVISKGALIDHFLAGFADV
jgi:hypothetical protein